jgi:cell division protein ZapA
MMKQFEENYAVRDKQDVLAMCALQFASQAEQNKLTTLSMVRKPSKIKINALLDQYLDN